MRMATKIARWIFVVSLSVLLVTVVSFAGSEEEEKSEPINVPKPSQIPRDKQVVQQSGRSMKPDLTVTEIQEDNGKIVVKIKNVGLGGLKDSDYSTYSEHPRQVRHSFVELQVDGVRSTKPLVEIDSRRALSRPGGEVVWNTGKNVWKDLLDTRTLVVATVDQGNLIDEANENNNTLRRVFSKGELPAPRSSVDLRIAEIKQVDPSYTFFDAELMNVGNQEFQGDISLELWAWSRGGWQRVRDGGRVVVTDTNGEMVCWVVSHLQAGPCTYRTIPPGEKISFAQCVRENYIFSISHWTKREAVSIKIVLRTSNARENRSNNEFTKAIPYHD